MDDIYVTEQNGPLQTHRKWKVGRRMGVKTKGELNMAEVQ